MGQQDIYNKVYMSQPDIFADAFNYYLYDGKQNIKANDLQELDSEEALAPYTKSGVFMALKKARDVLKVWNIAKSDGKRKYVILGIENQSKAHYAMAVRNMLYDAMSYAIQVGAIARENKANINDKEVEFLSGIKPTDKITPVITLVMFFSPEKWDGARTLYEMFDCDMQELAQFVPNYTLNILSPAEIEEPEKFQSSLQQALQVIKYSNDKDKLCEVVNADPKFRKIDLTTAKMLSFNTNYKLTDKLEGGFVNMCKAFDDIKLEGKIEGKAEDVKNLMKNTGWTIEKAMAALGLDEESRSSCIKALS